MKDVQRQEQFLQRGERLQKNQVTAAVEQRADLFAEKRLFVIGRNLPICWSQRKRPDRPADKNIATFERLARNPGGAPVDLADLKVQSVAGYSQTIRAKAVRLNHLRTGIGIFLINARQQLRLREVQFLQTMIQGHAQFI